MEVLHVVRQRGPARGLARPLRLHQVAVVLQLLPQALGHEACSELSLARGHVVLGHGAGVGDQRACLAAAPGHATPATATGAAAWVQRGASATLGWGSADHRAAAAGVAGQAGCACTTVMAV